MAGRRCGHRCAGRWCELAGGAAGGRWRLVVAPTRQPAAPSPRGGGRAARVCGDGATGLPGGGGVACARPAIRLDRLLRPLAAAARVAVALPPPGARTASPWAPA